MIIISILGIALGLLPFFVFFFSEIYGPIRLEKKSSKSFEDSKENLKTLREKRWLEQEKEDKEIIVEYPDIAKSMEMAFSTLDNGWGGMMILYEEFPNKEKVVDDCAETALRSLTPALFLDNYYRFKTKDAAEIKDAIYKERPYYMHALFIEMAIFIFEKEKNIYLLNRIIDGTGFNKYVEGEITQKDREKAKKILAEELGV